MLQHLRQQMRGELLAESRKHTITVRLRQIPSLGPIRSALAVALIQTPHRFRTKMWRKEWDYEQMRKVRFARGRARTSPGCVVDHRRNDWASHSPHGEFEVVIMIEVVIEEMVGSD